MKVIAGLMGEMKDIPAEAGALEDQGADIISSVELGHDPLLQLAMAATGTEKARLMTGRPLLSPIGNLDANTSDWPW